MKIAASFLSIKDNLKENIDKLAKTSIDYLHLDIMDGKFVPNKTWNRLEIEEIISYEKPFDIHFMVEDVYSYVDEFASLKPEFMTFHYETNDVMEKIMYIKNKGIKVGLSINPDTKIESITPYLPFLDLVLVMSVTPGLGGQKFIEDSISKIDFLNQIRTQYHYSYLIEVDGGINDITIKKVKNVDIAVVGSFITNGNYQENIKKLGED